MSPQLKIKWGIILSFFANSLIVLPSIIMAGAMIVSVIKRIRDIRVYEQHAQAQADDPNYTHIFSRNIQGQKEYVEQNKATKEILFDTCPERKRYILDTSVPEQISELRIYLIQAGLSIITAVIAHYYLSYNIRYIHKNRSETAFEQIIRLLKKLAEINS